MSELLTAPTVQEEKLQTPYVSIWMDGEILCCKYAENLDLTLEIAKSLVESRIQFTGGVSYPALIDIRGLRSTTVDARHYMASIGTSMIKAGAIITGSSVNRTLGNIFLTIDRPIIPTRLFTGEEGARKWLSQFI